MQISQAYFHQLIKKRIIEVIFLYLILDFATITKISIVIIRFSMFYVKTLSD